MIKKGYRDVSPGKAAKSDEGSNIRGVVQKNLQGLLETMDWGIPDLHRRSSYSIPFLRSLLRGEQNPTIDALYVIALSLGVQTHQLLNPRFEPPARPPLADMLRLSNTDIETIRKQTDVAGTPSRRFLAAHLARLIALNGITVSALFEDTHVAASTIHKCLKGKQNITLDTVVALADGLGVDPFVLLLPTDAIDNGRT